MMKCESTFVNCMQASKSLVFVVLLRVVDSWWNGYSTFNICPQAD